MVNKKNYGGMLTIVLTFGLLLVGCASTIDGGRYNTDSPAENDCSLMFKGVAPSAYVKIPHVTSFDGAEVNWKGEMGSTAPFRGKSFTVKIPAGNHTLDGVSVGYTGTSPGKLSVSYTFAAGHTYTVTLKDNAFQILDTTK